MMKKLFLLSFFLGSFSSLLWAQQTQWKWAKQYGSTDYENILDIATDRQGNVYGVGYLQQSGAQINTVVFAGTSFTTGGGKDGFVAKWDSLGTLIWIKQLRNAEDASVNRVVCDSVGNVFIAGSFLGTVDVAGISLNAANINNNFGNAFWAKINPLNGTAVWAQKLNLSTSDASYVSIDALCLDKTGNLYLGGTFDDELRPSSAISIISAGFKDGFVAQSSSTGQINWVRTYGGGLSDVDEQYVLDLVADNHGNLFVGGTFFNYINVGGTTNYNLENTPFVSKMDISTGTSTWFKWGSTTSGGFSTISNSLTGLGLDSLGNVYACGNFGRDITWGATTLTNNDNTLYYGDFYVVKFDNAGTVTWAKSWGGSTFNDLAYDIAVNKDGSYYLVGAYGSSTDFGAGVVLPVGGQGYNSAYVAKYTTTGALTWLRTIGNTTDPENGYIYTTTSDRFGNVFVGSVVESASFHYDNTVYSSNSTNGNSDIGVARMRDKTIVINSLENELPAFKSMIYPNPCHRQFIIDWDEIGSVSLFNNLGQTVLNKSLVRGKNEILLPANLATGTYFLQLKSLKGTTSTRLMIDY